MPPSPLDRSAGGAAAWRLLPTLAAATLVLTLSGCLPNLNGSQPTASDSNPLAAARAAAAKLDTASAQTVHVNGTTSAGVGNLKISGVEQFQPALAADLKLDFSSAQLGALSGGTMEVILKDGIEYVNLGALGLGGLLQGTRPWLKIDFTAATNIPGAAGGLSSLIAVDQSTDPAQQVRLLLTSANLKKVGTETVDGVTASHYSGTVDVVKVVQQGAGSALTADQLQRLKNTLQQSGVTTEAIDLWLSSSALPVEVKTVVNTKLVPFTADIHYSDWGSPVTVNAPPADQVTDISGLSGFPRLPTPKSG
jgi:hypothetical protein